jgi:hypothetical protein
MAVIRCAACGTTVNAAAVACPNCGGDPRSGEPGRFGPPPSGPTGGGGAAGGAPASHDLLGVAWAMYRGNLGWLALGGLIAAVIELAIVGLVLATWFGAQARSSWADYDSLGALLAAMTLLAAGLLVAQLFSVVLRGGMTKMVIDGARSGRRGEPASLFSGFARLGSYAGLWGITTLALPLAIFVAMLVAAVAVGPLALLVGLACIGVGVWLGVCWVYGLPLIADRKLGPIAALARSREMVRRDGWWLTFGPLFVVGLVVFFIEIVLRAVSHQGFAGRAVNVAVVEIVVMPFMACFVASMYLGSEKKAAAVSGAPPAYGPPAYGPPAYGPPAYGPPPAFDPPPAHGLPAAVDSPPSGPPPQWSPSDPPDSV